MSLLAPVFLGAVKGGGDGLGQVGAFDGHAPRGGHSGRLAGAALREVGLVDDELASPPVGAEADFPVVEGASVRRGRASRVEPDVDVELLAGGVEAVAEIGGELGAVVGGGHEEDRT